MAPVSGGMDCSDPNPAALSEGRREKGRRERRKKGRKEGREGGRREGGRKGKREEGEEGKLKASWSTQNKPQLRCLSAIH